MLIQDEKAFAVTEKAVRKNDFRDISAEYTLPDYLPDINRLLRVSAEAERAEKYCSGNEIEYDGKIICSIVYATADGEIRCAVFDSDYSGSVSAGEMDFSAVAVETRTENVSCRLSGPRQFTVKCKLCATVNIFPARSPVPTVAGKGAQGAETHIQYRKKRIEFTKEAIAEEKNTPVSEDIEIEPGMPPIERIVFVNLLPCALDIRTQNGKLSYSGSLMAEVLYESDSAERKYVSFSREVPVSGTIESTDARDDAFILCDMEAVNISFRPQTNELGETKTVELDFDYSVYARIFLKESAEITVDAYSTLCESTNEAESFKYTVPEVFKSFNFSFGESEECGEDGYENVVFASAEASLCSVERTGNRTAIGGNVVFYIILEGTGGSFISKTLSFPFKAETDAGKYAELFSHISKTYASDVNVRSVGGKLYCDCEITACIAIFGEKDAEALTATTVHTDRPVVRTEKGNLLLYYPVRGESLWSVAKKYYTTEEKLSAANDGIKEITAGSVLMIPMEKPRTLANKR
jgi:hypothetical protein